MTTLPKMTQEDKDGLIALHMAMRTVDRHSADSALVQSLGKFLLEDACTPDDAADILKAVFDEKPTAYPVRLTLTPFCLCCKLDKGAWATRRLP